MERSDYIQAIRGILSRDSQYIREANRALYRASSTDRPADKPITDTEADLVLAEAAHS